MNSIDGLRIGDCEVPMFVIVELLRAEEEEQMASCFQLNQGNL